MSAEENLDTLGVIYLIRFGDPISRLVDFLASIPNEIPKEVRLYIIVKSCGNETFLKAAREILSSSMIDATLTEVSDKGFDLGAYLDFSKSINENLVLLMSSSSRFSHNVNFAQLIGFFKNPTIGLVGAMASRESMRSTLVENRKHRIMKHIKFNQLMKVANLLTFLSIIIQKESRRIYRTFPDFPNTHIRTTGFVIRKEILWETILVPPTSKFETLALESGHSSVYNKLKQNGFTAALVINSLLVDPETKNAEKSFRSLNELQPFVFDHWWLHFHQVDEEDKKVLIEQTWGRR
jgi:hypothetical protein